MKLLKILILLCLTSALAYGQDEIEKYTIEEINVKGNQYADANALKVVAGLKQGQTIIIPDDIQTAVKNLWNLKLFTDIRIVQTDLVNENISLEIQVLEKPKLSRFDFVGVKSSAEDDVEEAASSFLTKGGIVTEANKARAVKAIEEYYADKGYLDASVIVKEVVDTNLNNAMRLTFDIDRGERIKIQDILFEGNTIIGSKKLRKKMKETKTRKRFLASSKFIEDDYDSDQIALIDYYNTLGFRDAKILRDSMWRDDKERLVIKIFLDEGKQYYYRNITWKGNTLYTSEQLSKVLDIHKGDVYNQEQLVSRLTFSLEGNDVSALYQDDGYLFFNADPTEVAIIGDSIDVEIRMFEGPQATVDKVVINGNDRTHEHVIRRELATRPGKKFSRSDIIRSQRKIIALGYFDQEKLDIGTPVNPDRGTVDIVYGVEERSSDQLELSAGYQPSTEFSRGGLIGTFGLSFNNFSLRNIFNPEAWHPLPQGDGQKLTMRAQSSGRFFRSYNFSFTEPWLGGKKPNSFTLAASSTKSASFFDISNYVSITQLSLGLGKQLKWPDENFILSNSLNFQQIRLRDFSAIFQADDGTPINNGDYNNFYISSTLARNTIYDNLFPKEGSLISLNLQITPPYSAFSNRTYSNDDLQEKYRWIEYYKVNFKAIWYKQLGPDSKFVIKAAAKMGSVSTFSDAYGPSPFERFQFAAEPLQNQNTIVGLDPIWLRGYSEDDGDFASTVNNPNGPRGAGVYNKYTLELRYPLSLNPTSTIYGLAFIEGGNSWNNLSEFNPFDIRRSVGAGVRVFLPMFGLLGFDYSIGFDKPNLIESGAGIGEFGKFTILLGFEPE